MKKLFTLTFLSLFCISLFAQKTQIKVTVDTKKFINIDCSLGADGAGGATPLNRVYLHSGLCTTGDIYCKTQIIPLHSLVWEHVVGNWGNNPQDDGIGEMINEGNGVFSKTIIVEDYYSDPTLVNTDWNETNTVQSSPMPAGATPFTVGLVFRSPDGLITGRDNMCNDIFVTDINTDNPKVIQSFDLQPWPNSPVTIERTVIGIDDTYNINFFSISPNPVREILHVEFYLNTPTHTSVQILDALGRTVYTLLNTRLSHGKHVVKAQTNDLQNLTQGVYFVNIQTDYGMKTERFIVVN